MKLKGQARVWWNSVEEYHHRLRLLPIFYWDEMKPKLQEKYLPLDYEDSIFFKLIALRQGTTTMGEYTPLSRTNYTEPYNRDRASIPYSV